MLPNSMAYGPVDSMPHAQGLSNNPYPESNESKFLYLNILLYYKILELFFSCKDLVDFNESRLLEATLDLHIHACILSCLSTASVNGKQNLGSV